jgi:hypothetical protein
MNLPSSKVLQILLPVFVALIVFLLLWWTESFSQALERLPNYLAGITAIAVALFLLLYGFRNWLRRYLRFPGNVQLDQELRHDLNAGVALLGNKLRSSMVPIHDAKAKPAIGTRSFGLGDAKHLLSTRQIRLLRRFLGRRRISIGSNKQLQEQSEKNVLFLTGEPGAGKTVLLQELFATFALGTRAGHPTYVPIVIFARDLLFESLAGFRQEDDSALRAFVTEYLRTIGEGSAEELGLSKLASQLNAEWEKLDLLLIIDGLDEIPERSAYEEIQRLLREFIRSDSRCCTKAVHRYMVSCRIDEDLDLFSANIRIHLGGVTDSQRTKICEALVESRDLTRELRRTITLALSSPNLVPGHVFRRNPYFLALAVRYFHDHSDTPAARKLDFSDLMKSYLAREAMREARRLPSGSSIPARDQLFKEIEPIASLFSQLFAINSASRVGGAGLYGKALMSAQFLQYLARSATIETLADSAWNTFQFQLNRAAESNVDEEVPRDALERLSQSAFLREVDLRLLYALRRRVSSGPITQKVALEALGQMPFSGIVERAPWYDSFCADYVDIVSSWAQTPSLRLLALLLLRSLVAAQCLRILSVDHLGNGIYVRFRHRRLAEYYAACYLRDRWHDVYPRLQMTPWLGPVLNITCTMQSADCEALNWLISLISPVKDDGYTLRQKCEAAVEASFFAVPGVGLSLAVKRLSETLLKILFSKSRYVSRRFRKEPTPEENKPRTEIVTAFTAIRLLTELGALGGQLSEPVNLSDASRSRIGTLKKRLPPEWLTLLFSARHSIARFSDVHPASWDTLGLLWRIVQKPQSVLLWTPSSRDVPLGLRLLAYTFLFIGECMLLALVYWLGLRFGSWLTSDSTDVRLVRSVVQGTGGAFGAVWCIARLGKWSRNPLRAAFVAAFPYRLFNVSAWISGAVVFILLEFLFSRAFLRFLMWTALIVAGLIGSLALPFAFIGKLATSIEVPRSEAVAPALVPVKNETTIANKSATPATRDTEIKRHLGLEMSALIKSYSSRVAKDSSLASRNDFRAEVSRDVGVLQSNYPNWKFPYSGGNLSVWDATGKALQEKSPTIALLPSATDVPPVTPEDLAFVMNVGVKYGGSIAEGPLAAFGAIFAAKDVEAAAQRLAVVGWGLRMARWHGFGIADSGSGPLLSVTDDEGVLRLEEVIAKLPEAEEKLKVRIELLQSRWRGLLTSGGFYGPIALGFLAAFLVAYARKQDARTCRAIAKLIDLESLCDVLRNRVYSETVRRAAVQRISEVGAKDHVQLRYLEDAATELTQRSGVVDSTIGVSLMHVVRNLGKRLDHYESSAMLPTTVSDVKLLVPPDGGSGAA